MFVSQFVILLLPALVASAPLEDEEGSAFIPMNALRGRTRTSTFSGSKGASPLAFLNSPYVRRDKVDFRRTFPQRMLGEVSKDRMDERALQRKLTWQKAIIKEVTRSHPDQVLPIGHDELKRSRCNALPFIQNIFKENCSPVQITNKFCFGQCNSFYVPGLPGGFSQPCTSCSPVRTRPIVVPLLCHGGRLVLEKVDLVVECGCGGRSNEDTKKEGSGGGFLSVS